MLAYRSTWIVKEGKMDDAVALLMDTGKKMEHRATGYRVYTPKLSPNELVYEETWDSEEEHDAGWILHGKDLERLGFWEAWYQLVERHLGTYLWNVDVPE